MRTALIIIVLTGLWANKVYAQNRDEFNGPFSSWADIKLRFHAKGDGKTDDTRAFQQALDSLTVVPKNFNTGKTGYTSIFIPAGTYKISTTLLVKGKIGIQIIGEDPGKTIIQWYGPANSTMFWGNGSAYYKISRISFDANNNKGITGIGINWRDKWNTAVSQSYAALNIEISDCRFAGKCTIGISGGTNGSNGTNANDSEISILRCLFFGCTAAGIDIMGYNALDYWIWDCRFLSCFQGIHCNSGNYHVYRSYFEKLSNVDLVSTNTPYSSARGCYSLSPYAFFNDLGSSCNPFKRIFQGNTVTTASQPVMQTYHLGKLTLLDNIFQSSKTNEDGSTLRYSSWCPGIFEILSVNNRFEQTNPWRVDKSKTTIFNITDRYNSKENIPSAEAFLKTQQSMPLFVKRKIFEVPENATAAKIQSIIDQAATLKGGRPVIHFPFGKYQLSAPLAIPAGADMQLAGDGFLYASVLVRTAGFPAGRALIEIKGPSYITLRDLELGVHDNANAEGTALSFINVDQPGSQAFIDQLYSSATTSVYLKELDNLYVEKDNSFFSAGNTVIGGNLRRKGQGTAGLYCYGGQYADLHVDNGGNFVAKDCWWEGDTRTPLKITGSGKITIDGFMLAPNKADSLTSIEIGNFTGQISIMDAYMQGGINVLPNNPGLDIMCWNIHFYHKMDPSQFVNKGGTYRGGFMGFTTQCFTAGRAVCDSIHSKEDRYNNISDRNTFINSMVMQDRQSIPKRFAQLPNGVSNIFLSRLSVGGCKTAIVFAASAN